MVRKVRSYSARNDFADSLIFKGATDGHRREELAVSLYYGGCKNLSTSARVCHYNNDSDD